MRTHTARVENQKKTASRGGRPAKEEHERASVKLNCWVTPLEFSHLQTQYKQAKAGGKLAFAQFMKQILLAKKQRVGPKTDELLLSLVIKLQERGRQLEAIKALLGGKPDECESRQAILKVGEELEKIRQVITQITKWLYES